jgi:hypothetical protein
MLLQERQSEICRDRMRTKHGQAGVDPAWPLFVLVPQAHTYKGAIPVERTE